MDYVRTGGVETESMLAYIKERREMFALLIYNGQFMDMNSPLQRRVFEETIRYSWPAGAEMDVPETEWKYMLQYMFMGGSGAIHQWVRNGCDMEPAELAEQPAQAPAKRPASRAKKEPAAKQPAAKKPAAPKADKQPAAKKPAAPKADKQPAAKAAQKPAAKTGEKRPARKKAAAPKPEQPAPSQAKTPTEEGKG